MPSSDENPLRASSEEDAFGSGDMLRVAGQPPRSPDRWPLSGPRLRFYYCSFNATPE